MTIPAPADRPLTILLADDHPINRLLVCAMLAKSGHQIEAVDDGEQVVAALARRGFDLVLMDLEMPRVDGFEATRRLRAAGHRVPVIALTARATRADAERCLAAGMDAHLAKPIDRARLFALVAEIGQRPARDEAPAPDVGFEGAQLLARVDGDRGLLRLVLDVYRRDSVALLAEIEAASAPAPIARAAHRLVGIFFNLGAPRAAAAARALEQGARADGCGAEIDGAIARLRAEMDALERLLAALEPAP